MILVSIIVPVYNVEKYLERCIDSLVNQTLKDIEIILVDDGSTDSSGRICDEYAKKDKRIKVIHKENGGLSQARNFGLDIANGRYLQFVDGDDFIHKQMVEILYDTIINNNADISICDFDKVYENTKIKYKKLDYNTINVKIYNNIESLNQLYSKDVIKFVIAWNKLYKKELFTNLRYRDGKIHEDEFIIHELLFKSKKVVYIPLKLYYYLQREDSIMKSTFGIKRLDGLDAYRERIEFFKKINERELVEKAVFIYSREFYIYYYKLKNQVDNSKKYLRKIKKDYIMLIKDIIINPYYTKKEKIIIIIFCINSKLYEIYIDLKKGEIQNATRKLDNGHQA